MQAATKHRLDIATDVALSVVCALGASFAMGEVLREVPAAASDTHPAGQLVERRGEVQRRSKGRLAWAGLSMGAAVYDGDAVYTSDEATARLRLADGAEVELNENSLVIVRNPRARAAKDPQEVLVVRGAAFGTAGKGDIRLTTGKLSTDLSNGAAAWLRPGEAGAAEVDVRAGSARVQTAGGQTLEVPEGYTGVIEEGSAQMELAEPDLELVTPARDERVYFAETTTTISFRWATSDAETPYVFELATDPSFKEPLVRNAEESAVTVEALEPGIYYWRVRSGDGRSLSRRLLLIRDRPPAPALPLHRSVVIRSELPLGQVHLTWEGRPEASEYEVELTPEGGGRAIARLRSPRPAAFYDKAVPEGNYCFRVRIVERHFGSRPWSRRQCFELLDRPRLDAPELLDPEVDIPEGTP